MTYTIRLSSNEFPSERVLLENNIWYNIWRIEARPFNSIDVNDYVYVNIGENIFLRAKVTTLVKHHFKNSDNLMNILMAFSYQPHNDDPYWVSKLDIEAGVLLAYKFSRSAGCVILR